MASTLVHAAHAPRCMPRRAAAEPLAMLRLLTGKPPHRTGINV